MTLKDELRYSKRRSFSLTTVLLVLYHILFTIIAYTYIITNGGDANLYWFQNNSVLTQGKTWLDFFNYGTDVILFINYPFAKLLGLPLWFGFLLYSFLGFLGILQFKKLAELWLDKKKEFFSVNVFLLLIFIPNLHFWTANLGKEALCFLCISTIFLQLYRGRFISWQFILSLFFLMVLRPHIAIMLVFSVGVIYALYNNWNFWKCITYISSGLLLLIICFYLFLQLSKVRILNWERLKYFNDYSILSFQHSGSYVPMLDYNYIEKLFAFYFRPLFYDAYNVFMFVLSLENFLILVLHTFSLAVAIRYGKEMKTDKLFKIIVTFTLISVLLFVQRYAGLGIFVRTKSMVQPFTILALVWLLSSIRPKIALTSKKKI